MVEHAVIGFCSGAVSPVVDGEDSHAESLGAGFSSVGVIFHGEAVIGGSEEGVAFLPLNFGLGIFGAVHHNEGGAEGGQAALDVFVEVQFEAVLDDDFGEEALTGVEPFTVAVHDAETTEDIDIHIGRLPGGLGHE